MTLLWEKWYPLLLGVLAGVVYLCVPTLNTYKMPPSFGQLLSSVVSIAGIAIGFLATAKSILITIDEKDIIKKLRKAGYYQRIVQHLRDAVRWSFLLALLSACGLVVDMDKQANWTWWHSIGMSCWIGVAVTSTLTYFRVIQVFYAIINSLGT